MTYHILIFTHRKPGMDPAAFKSHYETTHVPLLQSIAGSHFPKVHARRYVHRTESSASSTDDKHYPATVLMGAQSDFEYDAIAELVFNNETAYQTFFGLVCQQEGGEKFAKDEEMFLDRSKTKVVVLGDCLSTSGPEASS